MLRVSSAEHDKIVGTHYINVLLLQLTMINPQAPLSAHINFHSGREYYPL